MGLRDMLLDEDCNRCEGDVPETKRLPQLPKEKIPIAYKGEADIIEHRKSDVVSELRELLGG